MKTCKSCGEEKQLSEFGVASKTRDGLQRLCIVCNRKQAREYYHSANKKSLHVLRAKERQRKIAVALNDIKEMAGCHFCGERCSVSLDFHHLGDDKEFTIATSAHAISKFIEEIDKCEVLCSNCHRKVHGCLLDVENPRMLDKSPMEKLLVETRAYKSLSPEEV